MHMSLYTNIYASLGVNLCTHTSTHHPGSSQNYALDKAAGGGDGEQVGVDHSQQEGNARLYRDFRHRLPPEDVRGPAPLCECASACIIGEQVQWYTLYVRERVREQLGG